MKVRRAAPGEIETLCARAASFPTTDQTLADLMVGALCVVALNEHGVPVAGCVLDVSEWDTVRVLAYGGASPQDLTVALDSWLRTLGARVVLFQTRRRGLIKKAGALGYRVVGKALNGVIMRKDF